MAELTLLDRRKLERPFQMGSGYVLNFSNRTFAEFVIDATGRDPYDPRYDHGGSGSKANRLRGFWATEPDHVVAKLLGALIDYGESEGGLKDDVTLREECRRMIHRLAQGSAVEDVQALASEGDSRDFDTVATQIRDILEKDQPEAGLDRLHTFTTKFLRARCEEHGIALSRERPLHSLIGEYVKRLRADGHLESQMAERILKSSISVLEAFNEVRNERSLAHDNPVLNHDESLLIFNHVASSIRFIRALEARMKPSVPAAPPAPPEDGLPF